MKNPFIQAAILAAAMSAAFSENIARTTLGKRFADWSASRKSSYGTRHGERPSRRRRLMQPVYPLRVHRKEPGAIGAPGSKLARKAVDAQLGMGQPL
jgi:hypothetical protein